MPDKHINTNSKILKHFRSKLRNLSGESQLLYTRSIKSLEVFVIHRSLSISSLSLTNLTDWAYDQLRAGLSISTIRQFANVINSLWNSAYKEGIIPSPEPVKQLRSLLCDYRNEEIQIPSSWFRSFKADREKSPVESDILLLSLLNGAMPLNEVATLRRDSFIPADDESRAIVERNSTPKRKYIFSLGQSSLTPRQLSSRVSEEIKQLLKNQLPLSSANADTIIKTIWVNMAIRCGAPASVALGCIPESHSLLLPSFCQRAETSQAVRESYVRMVADALSGNPLEWHAMRLRARTGYEEILREILEMDSLSIKPEFFYPCEAIRRRVKKKVLVEEHPLISGIVFFKSRITDILPIFRKIGDKAWCYRITSSPGAPYATIPGSEMARFQNAIGIFTPDTEIHPLGTLTPREGEQIIVIGGELAGKKGTFIGTGKNTAGSTIYKVKLAGLNGFEWRVNLDPRLIFPAPKN